MSDSLQTISDEVRIEIGGGDGDQINRESTTIIVDTTIGLGAQAIGSVVTITLTTTTTPTSPWTLYSVVISIILGLCFTFAAMSLRRNRPDLSVAMAKIGAVATALAIIIAVASRLPPLVAITVAPFALLIISVAIAFA